MSYICHRLKEERNPKVTRGRGTCIDAASFQCIYMTNDFPLQSKNRYVERISNVLHGEDLHYG